MPAPKIGRHLASLNLFREPDGTVEITVASGAGVLAEYEAMRVQGIETPPTPHAYAEMLIVAAAQRIVIRLTGQAIDKDAVAAATGIPKSFLFKEDMH